jgi:hypothetical protein
VGQAVTDYVVWRASPDWLNYDLADSRPFIRSQGLEEDLLERFAALWDSSFAVDFCMFRHRLKLIASATAAATSAHLATRDNLPDVQENDRIVFLDDDDWLAPNLFRCIPEAAGFDGYRWGSVRIGVDFDPTSPGAAMVQLRQLSPIVYTNNYAVTGRMIARHGWTAVFEHFHADPVFQQPETDIIDCPDYLSCAVKHPCATRSFTRLMADDGFRQDPVTNIRMFADRLESSTLPDGAAWMADPLEQLRQLFRELAPL